jgi:hypothetical protein
LFSTDFFCWYGDTHRDAEKGRTQVMNMKLGQLNIFCPSMRFPYLSTNLLAKVSRLQSSKARVSSPTVMSMIQSHWQHCHDLLFPTSPKLIPITQTTQHPPGYTSGCSCYSLLLPPLSHLLRHPARPLDRRIEFHLRSGYFNLIIYNRDRISTMQPHFQQTP